MAVAVIEGLAGRRILVTGARGFIGSALVKRLAATDCVLIRASRTPLDPISEQKATCETLIGDPSDPAFWHLAIGEAGADMVFHLAGQTSAYVAEADPEADDHANVAPVRHLIEACLTANRPVDALIAGTVTEAGLTERLPVNETWPDAPITVYDHNKLEAERCIEQASRDRLLRGACLRLPNIYGPGESVGSQDRGVLNKVIARAIAGQPITVFGDGSEVRDYLFIDDIVEAFVLTSLAMENASGRHFVTGTGTGHSLRQAFELVAAQVESTTGKPVQVETAPWPDGMLAIERRHFIADPAAIRDATGWRAKVALSEGIDRTIKRLQQETA
jgi:UDP-glucose 4-epimerase